MQPLRFLRFFSLLTAVLTIIAFGMAMATPPLSGPFCEGDCFLYPYADIAERFPRDYLWMYVAMLWAISMMIMILGIHHITMTSRRLFSNLAAVFASFGGLLLFSNYFIQVSVIQPSLLAGETEGIALLSQFNPHGIFIVLEEIGFFFFVLAFFCLVPLYGRAVPLERAIRWIAIISFILALGSFTAISLIHGIQREYFFEVAIISIAWLESILLSILLYFHFSKISKEGEC